MQGYRHHVSGHFAQREKAESAFSNIVELGLPRERLQLFESDAEAPALAPKADRNEVLKKIFADGVIGSAVGTGIGALTGLTLVAANVSLTVASPLVAALALLGWGAGLGGLIGAATGAGKKKMGLSARARDANANGQVVLVVETRSEQETMIAREGIQTSVGD